MLVPGERTGGHRPAATGSGTLDSTTLFAANLVILLVTAAAFAIAGRGRSGEPYWRSWAVANLLLAAALGAFIFERRLPDILLVTMPNALLVLGFGLRWRAAREFSGHPAPGWLIWAPCGLFLGLCALPFVFGSYGTVYTIVNVLLTWLALATAAEFWRRGDDRLPSRYGLSAAYAVMGLSFLLRVGQGLLAGHDMARHLPDDTMLAIHLTVALFHTVGAGAFALSLAYERSNAELRHAADHDALTGLLNRGAFERTFRERLKSSGGDGVTLALIDVDHFKRINDRYGHAAGDEALRECARLCRSAVAADDLVARIGGEEFAIVLADEPGQASLTIDRIRRTMNATVITAADRCFRITISAGICSAAAAPGDFDSLMRLADEGLYAAKNKGRNRIVQIAA